MCQRDHRLRPATVADIAELENQFNCIVEIRLGHCVITGYNALSEAGPIRAQGKSLYGIVADSNKPVAVKVIQGVAAVEESILHANVYVARLRFAAGTATASLCPAPTVQSCVEFLLHLSRYPHYREAWQAQSLRA